MSDTANPNFQDIRSRLEEIVEEVSSETISLDDALGLYEEAVRLGMAACEVSEEDLFPTKPESVGEGENPEASDGDDSVVEQNAGPQ